MNNDDNDSGSMVVEQGLVAMLNKSDIEQQIATAHKFPRSIKAFASKASALVTLTEETADDCIYALPRKDKNGESKAIEGPSVRFAEIIAHAWGNSRSGGRVIDDTGKYVTAQGVFHDLETNVAVTIHVQRRITGSNGRRYSDDMVGVTGNAATSIAYRNAVLKGIPKALWQPIYDQARKLLLGDVRTLSSRRDTMLSYYQKLGVEPAKVFDLLGVSGVEDITLEHLLELKGLATAIKDNETTIEQTFSPRATGAAALNDRLKNEPDTTPAAQEAAGATPAEPAADAQPAAAAAEQAPDAQPQEAKPRTRRKAAEKPPAEPDTAAPNVEAPSAPSLNLE